MIQSAITVSLVEEARGGPFVFWDGIADACEQAANLGFDAIEIFAPSHDTVDRAELKSLLEKFKLNVAAVGTGAGMVKHGLNLTDPDKSRREAAKEFIRQMIDFGAEFNAPAIIGSMQGRWGGDLSRNDALSLLAEALNELGEYAAQKNVPLIYEPLNRYETNLITTISHGVDYLKTLTTKNVKLLADLFHMNIEEADLAEAIRSGRGYIGHVHFVDSNRQATGRGHMDFAPIAAAMIETDFDGYASAEAFPIPDSRTAAENTIEAFRTYFRS
ncbi:sugar phosphate isomerase/epimerase family protein [Thalassoglobus sp. JC818]|uniref:sugar phosphate isomerase/epimerase family protein n=1 Tax=Thalassoglobus sp. JC818 TaxID=3232136 RepID=UPI00345A73F8